MTTNQAANLASDLILIRDNKVLLMHRTNTSFNNDCWGVPGGKVDENEDAKAAIIREANEEIGIILNKEDLTLVHTHQAIQEDDPRGNWICFFFKATKWENTPTNNEPHKFDKIAWHNLNNLPEKMMPHHKKAINSFLKNETFSIEKRE